MTSLPARMLVVLVLVGLLTLFSPGASDDCKSCRHIEQPSIVKADCSSPSIFTEKFTRVPTHCIRLDVTNINLEFNELSELRPYEFSNFTKLKDINLAHNLISVVSDTAFHGLHDLHSIHLQNNKLTEFPRIAAKRITTLELQENQISQIRRGDLDELYELMHLDLKRNQVSSISSFAFVDACRLRELFLGVNPLKHMGDYVFVGTDLRKLDVTDSSLEYLPSAGLYKLRTLLAKRTFSLKSFPLPSSLPAILKLDLTYPSHCCLYISKSYEPQQQCSPTVSTGGDSLEDLIKAKRSEVASEKCIPEPSCTVLKQLRYFPRCVEEGQFVGDHYIPACRELENATATPTLVLIPTFVDTSNNTAAPPVPVNCTPAPNDFNSCDDVMGNWLLRILVWVVIVVNIVGNVTVVTVFLANYKRFNAIKLLLCNMAFADVCMSIYLITLAIVDAVTFGEYADHAIAWKTGGGCQAIGFISVFSSILSLYSLTALTLERFYTIHFAMYGRRIKFKQALVFVVIGWIYALIMATMPLVGVSDYTATAICLPFDLSNGGRAYVIFGLAVNLLAFCIIAGVYTYLFLSLAGHGPMTSRSRDMNVLFKMMILVVVDFCCWMPIIILGLVSASNENVVISLLAAKYVMVFIYPLNSCANPFLYAIFTKPFKRDFFEFWYRFGYFENQYMQYSRPTSVRRSGTKSTVTRGSTRPGLPPSRGSQWSVGTSMSLATISTNGPRPEANIASPDFEMSLSQTGTELVDISSPTSQSHEKKTELGMKKSVNFEDNQQGANDDMQPSVDKGDTLGPRQDVPRQASVEPLMNK